MNVNKKKSTLEFKVFGKYGLFTEPVTKLSGEKHTLMIPTYEALKGICESIYWKPTIRWVIDSVRVLNPIKTIEKSQRPVNINYDFSTLSYYTYLTDVAYEVKAHFEFNTDYPELKSDYDVLKHISIAKRSLENGGRRDIFLGTRECQAYVVPVEYGSSESYYSDKCEIPLGLTYHGINYPNRNRDTMEVRFWNPVINNGEVTFLSPEQCKIIKKINKIYKDISYEFDSTIRKVDFDEKVGLL